MTPLADLDRPTLVAACDRARPRAANGTLPDYIPFLAAANPQAFAAAIARLGRDPIAAGEAAIAVPLMSVVKPFLLLYLLETVGPVRVWATVGARPSDRPFDDRTQLELDGGFPRNPMLNSGAIALCGLLPGNSGADRCEALRQWLAARSGGALELDEKALASVRSRPNPRNRALTAAIAAGGFLSATPELALDAYERICCLRATVADLAKLGLLLAVAGPAIGRETRQAVQAVLLLCGLYERSPRFALETGLPTKSGVSGTVLAIVPRQGAIAAYSPPLDAEGNSSGGLALVADLARSADLGIFG